MVANAGIGIRAADRRHDARPTGSKQNAINLDGVFLSVKHCLPLMRKTGGGSIVLMSSLAGLRGAPGLAAYSATKGGVRLFAKSIAMECAAAGDGIRCQLRASRHHRHADLGQDPDRRRPATAATRRSIPSERARVVTPLGRVGEAQDIANGVLFLCIRCLAATSPARSW